jgi:hypothetical protein
VLLIRYTAEEVDSAVFCVKSQWSTLILGFAAERFRPSSGVFFSFNEQCKVKRRLIANKIIIKFGFH